MTPIRTLPATAVAALVTGCGGASATRRDMTIIDASRNVSRQSDYGIRASFAAPRDSVFAALAAAYAEVGLAPDLVDTKEAVVARTQILIPRVFNGTRASLLFSCGETATGASLAENGQLYASARSQITGDFDRPTVMTLVDAFVVPSGGTSTNSLHCGSTGEIEGWILKKVAARVRER
ncbi:MAG: hypothetical protein HOQ12_09415 [Gemmatimonadaceae bacterium]|nr:hypothetical protein [Gemmatimonadaceae bacterium]NUQ92455.1 hypothetical protein [Gemmatimonadaceae bacterium]NUR19735.1 hypothetical protein [Gemmatimonadaceae bacterium]